MARGERTRLGSALVLGLLIATAGPARAAPTADSLGAPGGAFPLPTDTSTTVRPSQWTLVLSGGGARGLAHIGVLRVLEEEGLRPDLVVGTSMGALVGALWAGGATSDEIRARMDVLDWEGVFDPRRLAPEWRRTVVARPWMRFVAGGRGLGLPSGIVDDSELNYRLSVDLLEADARAQGDFDRLPIPFRAVATDAADLKPVSLAHGSVARAVRASISIPAVFPPVAQDSTLLVDGGVASNLPIGIARRAGAERVLAVDVSFPERALSEDESVLTLSVTLLDRVNRRGQTGDTTRAGDARVWIPLPHVSPAAWNETPRLVEMGYRDSRDSIRAWARAAGIARAPSAARDSALVLPPIAGPVQWFDRNGRPSRREDDARAVFGRLPAGRFRPSELVPGIERVYRAGLFESDWPWLRVEGDSTRIGMQVKEFPAAELDGAFAYDNDTEARMNARAVWRNAGGYAPGEVTLGGTLRKYGAEGFGSVSPHPLDRGSSGWFARAVSRTTEVRIFGPEGLDGLERVERVEGTLGLQRVLPWSDIVQVGAGGAWTRGGGQEAGGVLLAMRGEGTGTWHRVLEGAWRPGHLGYGTATLDLDRTHALGTDFTLRGAVALGWSSEQAPLDEWRGVGGPGSMPGLRAGEWLGRRMASAELRLTRILVSTLRARASVAVAGVGDAVGRTDLGEHAHVGAGIGLAFGSALGPLSLDYGIMDRSRFRVDVRIGASF